jgi:Replication protein
VVSRQFVSGQWPAAWDQNARAMDGAECLRHGWRLEAFELRNVSVVSTASARLGMNQEKFVDGDFPDTRLKWKSGDYEDPGAFDLSLEGERKFVETALTREINEGSRISERWALVEEAGRLLPEEAVSSCCRIRVPGKEIAIYREAESGHAFFAGVKRCGSVWMCAVCAAKITERRRQELRSGLDTWETKGGQVWLLTLTAPHHRGNDTRTLCDRVLAAYAKMRNRSSWRNWAKAIGLSGSVRSLEVTYGLNGPHVHIHVLLFCMPDEGSRQPSPVDLLPSWKFACISVGLAVPNKHGVDIRNGEYAASYVGKWGLDCELTKSHVKHGNIEGRTPWDLLRASIKGDTEAGSLFSEYAHAFKGRRQLCWSRGLRQILGLEPEKSDLELAEEYKEAAQLVAVIHDDDWQRIVRYRLRAKVLVVAGEIGAKGLEAFLTDLARRDRYFALKRWVNRKSFASGSS